MGSNRPRKMRPTISVILIAVSQNSISPYRRTLKRLKRIGMTRKMAIHAGSGTGVAQNFMNSEAVSALFG